MHFEFSIRHPAKNRNDQLAADLLKKLSNQRIAEEPWSIQLAARIAQYGLTTIRVPASFNFSDHTIDRFLINLRDATAHGDARNIEPFHVQDGNSSERLLAGFTFRCFEKYNREIAWQGHVTLLEDDMRRVGAYLAKTYCDDIRHRADHSRDGHFGRNAANSVKEAAA
jgi:hypothetical protein